MTQEPIIQQGKCFKQGGMIKSWKERWVILQGTTIKYYTNQDLKDLKGTIEIKPFFKVSRCPQCKKQPAFSLDSSSRVYLFNPPTENEANNWVSSISKVIQNLQPSQPHQNKQISIQEFQPVGVLGKGAYGKVILTKYKGDGKLYALKALSKQLLQENNLIDRIKRERDILMMLNHPFLVNATYSFQNDTHIFMALEYVPGGDFFSFLLKYPTISEEDAKKYTAMLLLAIGELHSNGIIHRDLKPENIMVDADGYLKITDFGLVQIDKKNESKCTTFCGSPEYMAPEIIKSEKYGKAVDWWALGVICYKILYSSYYSPFLGPDDYSTYNLIMNKELDFPDDVAVVSPEAKDFLNGLLTKDPKQRLGSRPEDFEQLKQHKWFEGFPWDDLLAKKLTMTYIPEIKAPTDISNFDSEFTNQSTTCTYVDITQIDDETQQQFKGFTVENTIVSDL